MPGDLNVVLHLHFKPDTVPYACRRFDFHGVFGVYGTFPVKHLVQDTIGHTDGFGEFPLGQATGLQLVFQYFAGVYGRSGENLLRGSDFVFHGVLFVMVADVQQAAHGYHLFAKNLPDRKFKAVLEIDADGRNTFFVTFQHLIVQGFDSEQIRHVIGGIKQEHRLLVASYDFGLVAVFTVACPACLVQFAQVVLVKLDNHFLPFTSAKIRTVPDIRKKSNTLLLILALPELQQVFTDEVLTINPYLVNRVNTWLTLTPLTARLTGKRQ